MEDYGIEKETEDWFDSDWEKDDTPDTEVEEVNTEVEDTESEDQEQEMNNDEVLDFGNYDEPADYSWILQDTGDNPLMEEAREAPMYAEAFSSTGTKTEPEIPDFGEVKEEDYGYYDSKGNKITDPEEIAKREDRETRKLISDFADLDGEITYGNLDKDQIKTIAANLNAIPENRSMLDKIIDWGTNFISLGAKPDFPGRDIPIIKDAKAFTDAVNEGYDPKELAKKAFASAGGSAKEGLEYLKITGDTNNNPYAELALSEIGTAYTDMLNGKMTEEDFAAFTEKVLDSPWRNFNSVVLNGLKKNYTRGIIMAAGAGVGQVVGQASVKIASKYPKILGKVLERNSKQIAEEMTKKTASPQLVKTYTDTFKQFGLSEERALKMANDVLTKPETAEKFIKAMAESFGRSNKATAGQAVQNAAQKLFTDASVKTGGALAEEALEKAKEVVGNTTGKAVAGVSAAVPTIAGTLATTEKANAAPTGIFDNQGRMIDSKELVKERQTTPYKEENAVTIQSREGTVQVSPKEAVVIGESENLTPTQGYTDEVKETAKGETIYEKEQLQKEVEQPGLPKLSTWTKIGDYIQAILGGRDLDGDRTITKEEWYQSTIGPVVEGFRNFFSGSDFKSRMTSVKNNISNTVDSIGIALQSSLPGVINLSTGEVQLQDRQVPITEDLYGEIKTKMVDAMPNWSDSMVDEAKKEAVAAVVLDKMGETVWASNLPAITVAKMAGSYFASTVGEIMHLSGNDIDNDQKGILNLIMTNAVGLGTEPISTVVRTIPSMYGAISRTKIENVLEYGSGEIPETFIIPYVEDNTNTTESYYGTEEDIDKRTVDEQYSGYRENAKNSNLASDYNEGMEKEVNEAVSDMHAKIFKIYSSEPDFIRKAIGKILKSYKEQY